MFERRPQLLHRLQVQTFKIALVIFIYFCVKHIEFILLDMFLSMKVFLGGRAAEEVIFGGDTSTASVAYLAHATWLARKIITM